MSIERQPRRVPAEPHLIQQLHTQNTDRRRRALHRWRPPALSKVKRRRRTKVRGLAQPWLILGVAVALVTGVTGLTAQAVGSNRMFCAP
jgi:hypothetical protein